MTGNLSVDYFNILSVAAAAAAAAAAVTTKWLAYTESVQLSFMFYAESHKAPLIPAACSHVCFPMIFDDSAAWIVY